MYGGNVLRLSLQQLSAKAVSGGGAIKPEQDDDWQLMLQQMLPAMFATAELLKTMLLSAGRHQSVI
jgi:hypothetical protein